MSEQLRHVFSRLLTGALGGVIAIVVLALLALGPLQARGGKWNPFAAALPACLLPPPPTVQMCLSNEAQIGNAVIEYVQDYDGQYPSGTQSATATPPATGTGVGWAAQIYPYHFRIGRVFQCPFDQATAIHPDFVTSYAINANSVGSSEFTQPNPYLTVYLFEVSGDKCAFRSPDENASLGATVYSSAGNGTDGGLLAGLHGTVVPGVVYATGLMAGRPQLAHGSQFLKAAPRDSPTGANYLFLDGHVQSLPPALVSTGMNASSTASPQAGGVSGTAAGTQYVSQNPSRYEATFSLN